MKNISILSERSQLMEDIDLLAIQSDGTPERQDAFLKKLIILSEGAEFKDRGARAMFAGAVNYVSTGQLDKRSVIERLLVPMVYSVKDEELALYLAQYIYTGVIEFHKAGAVLGSRRYDHLTCRCANKSE